MLERGEAKDLDHARRIIRNKRGLAGQLGVGGGGGGGGGRAGKGGGVASKKAGGAGGSRGVGVGGGGKRMEESETLFIQEGSVGLLIGKAGATIKKIQVFAGFVFCVWGGGGRFVQPVTNACNNTLSTSQPPTHAVRLVQPVTNACNSTLSHTCNIGGQWCKSERQDCELQGRLYAVTYADVC
jgi:hypothetical protein